MTNNSFSEDIYAVGQLMADNLNAVGVSDADVDDGLTTLANKILNATGSKISTTLTLNTPMVVYTDQFNVTGTLIDVGDNPIEDAIVQLIWNDGTEHIAVGTTNANGVFSFTSTDPASVSQYSFQLFFAGDNRYNSSRSSVVNVDTEKETTVLNITSPVSGATVTTNSVTVRGTLFDNDGEPIVDKVVLFMVGMSEKGSVHTDEDGVFEKTLTDLSIGSNTIRARTIANTIYTYSDQSIIVNRTAFDGLSDIELFDGSQILSYADEQQDPYVSPSPYATLETQLMNGDSPAAISGIAVAFYDYSDENNPVLLGSDDTDSSGTASLIYYSRGVGDVPIKAKVGSIVSETYTIEDCLRFNALTSDDGLFTSSSATISYSSDGMHVSYGDWSQFNLIDALPQNCSLEFDINQIDGSFYNFYSNESGGPASTHSTERILVSTGHYKITLENGVLNYYKGDTRLYTETWTETTSYWWLWTNGTLGSFTLKNLKIKPLHSHDDGEHSSGGADVQI